MIGNSVETTEVINNKCILIFIIIFTITFPLLPTTEKEEKETIAEEVWL